MATTQKGRELARLLGSVEVSTCSLIARHAMRKRLGKGRTTRVVANHTQGGLSFDVPAGARVTLWAITDGMGHMREVWEVEPSALPVNSIERHDATYYGVEVPADAVEPEREALR